MEAGGRRPLPTQDAGGDSEPPHGEDSGPPVPAVGGPYPQDSDDAGRWGGGGRGGDARACACGGRVGGGWRQLFVSLVHLIRGVDQVCYHCCYSWCHCF
jgi:hypothetical protein